MEVDITNFWVELGFRKFSFFFRGEERCLNWRPRWETARRRARGDGGELQTAVDLDWTIYAARGLRKCIWMEIW